jgi:stage III sporulation protein AG
VSALAKWLERLESFIGGGTGGGRRVKTFRWLVLLGLIGAALLLASSLLHVKKVVPQNQTEIIPPGDQDSPQQQETFLGNGGDKNNAFTVIESELESRLKDLLETIVGVGSTSVLVTVESTEETVVQLNEKKIQQLTNEADRNGTSRHITDITSDGQVVLYEVSSGIQAPIIVKKLKPRVRGVIVVAKGAENATVHRLVQEAVSRGLDVPMHRISVVPRKT